MEKQDIKNLKKRYLIWSYKQTKEAMDKVDRKFTQLEVDHFILEELRRLDTPHTAKNYIEEFKIYIQNKEKEGLVQKYDGKNLRPEYNFLRMKLKAVEKAIVKEFGKKGLSEIKELYENEMIKRILEERQHKL
jgi:hypothetical protein